MSGDFVGRMSFALLALASTGANGQGVPSVARPSFDSGKGPVVAIDEAHKNTHTFGSPQFRGFVEQLNGDGYRVRSFADRLARSTLTGIDVLIISGPGGWDGPDASLNETEVAALLEWVRGGGSLLLILDHMPAPLNAARLTAALGVPNWHNGYAMVDLADSLPVGNIIFWRSDSFPGGPRVGATGPSGGRGYQGTDAVLAKHPITEGRAEVERVRRVATFVGSAFQPTPGIEALLIMPSRTISLTPSITPGAVPAFTAATPRVPVGEWVQGAVMRLGQGRVAIFGEAGMFSGGPAADNRTFGLNVMRWLSGLL